MLDLMNIGITVLPPILQVPLLNIKIEDIKIDIEPSDIPMLPTIHIEAKLDIKLGFQYFRIKSYDLWHPRKRVP